MNYNGDMEKVRDAMERWMRSLLILLGILLAAAVALLVWGWYRVGHEHPADVRDALSGFVAKHGPLTADEVGVIRPWMTFDYVNTLFALPPDFLKDSFRIDDPSYPMLTLGRYAGEAGYGQTEFLTAVEAAIANHLAPLH